MRSHLPAALFLAALAACAGDGSPLEVDGDSGTPQTPTLRFGETKLKTAEGPGVLGVPVTLSFASGLDLAVPFTLEGSASDGFDFVLVTPSPLELPAGQLQAEILFQVLDDGIGEIDESLRLQLGETPGAKLGAESGAVARIEDDDQLEVEELEPNDEIATAQHLDPLLIEEAVHARGLVQSPGAEDPFDVYRVLPRTDLRLRLALDVLDPTGDVALRVLDEAGATLLLLDEFAFGELEEGALDVAANVPVFLEISCSNIGTEYRLQVAAEPRDGSE